MFSNDYNKNRLISKLYQTLGSAPNKFIRETKGKGGGKKTEMKTKAR